MSTLHPAVKVKRDSVIEGAGLIADQPIKAGETLFRYEDTKPPAHFYQIVDWPPQKRVRFLAFAIQIGEDDFSFQQGDIKFINHSCDPTGYWSDYGVLTARRDISPGDEITYDYSTSDITLSYSMECLCKTPHCRGTVTNREYLDPAFQARYEGQLAGHVQEAIRKQPEENQSTGAEEATPVPDCVKEAVNLARSQAASFKAQFGNQHRFEMVKQAIRQVTAAEPDWCREKGARHVFETVRNLMLQR